MLIHRVLGNISHFFQSRKYTWKRERVRHKNRNLQILKRKSRIVSKNWFITES